MADRNFSVLNYAMYEDKTEYLGMTEVSLPSLDSLTQKITGAGIYGEIEVVLAGQLSAMEMTINMSTLNKQGVSLSAPRTHTWELREAQQALDTENNMKINKIKHIIKAVPKSLTAGTLKPNSTSDPKLTASILSWQMFIDNKLYLHVDPLNRICILDGVDYAAEINSALGK